MSSIKVVDLNVTSSDRNTQSGNYIHSANQNDLAGIKGGMQIFVKTLTGKNIALERPLA